MPNGASDRVARVERVLAFFAIDVRALALGRIAFASLVLVDLLRRAPAMRLVQGPEGLYPVELARDRFDFAVSIYTVSDAMWLQWLLFGLAAVFAVGLLVGFWSRTCALFSWYLFVSLSIRNLYLTDVGDHAIALVLFWFIFVPIGGRYSVDEWRLRARGLRTPVRVASIATAGYLLQIAFIVFFSTYWKLTGTTWLAGDALQWAVSDDVYSRAFGDWVLHQPLLARLLTWGTLLTESTAPILLLATPPRWQGWVRPVVLLGLAALFTGFGVGIELALVPFIMISTLFPFIPGEVMDRVIGAETDAPDQAAPVERRPWLLRSGVPALALAMALILNVDDLLFDSRIYDSRFGVFLYQVRLAQNWSMFAPDPRLTSFRLIFVEAYEDGSTGSFALGARRPGWPELPTNELLERVWNDHRMRWYFTEQIGPRPVQIQPLRAAATWYCRQAETRPFRVRIQKVVRRPRVREPDAEIRSVVASRTLVPFVDCEAVRAVSSRS